MRRAFSARSAEHQVEERTSRAWKQAASRSARAWRPLLVARQNIQRRVNYKSNLQGIPSRTPDSRQTQLPQLRSNPNQ